MEKQQQQQQQQQQKQPKNIKRQLQDNDIDQDEEEYDNNEEERKLPAKQHDNNEEEEGDDDDNDKDDNAIINDNPRCLLPNCTHSDLDNSYNVEIGEVARLQATEHLVSPNNLNRCTDYHKYDYHKCDADLPLYKLDPFTTGAYVNKCVNEKLFSRCNLFRHDQDIDQFMALVFDAIGMNGNRPEDRYKQMTSWGAIRKMIKKGHVITDSYVSIDGKLQQKVSCLLLS